METWHTYILWSDKLQKFYFGATSNLANRLEFHNNGYERFTSKCTPWKLVWSCSKPNNKEAIALERRV